MKSLFVLRGFLPLLTLIFLNAFIDLGHKITVQNTIFKLYDGQQQIILTAVINSFILLPYIVFFAPAGKLSDRLDKALVLRITSCAAFVIMVLISLCYYFSYFWAAFFLTLVLALQSAFYGPAKLGYLKELVPNSQLKIANGFVQSLLMLAILSGILVFSALFEILFHTQLTTPETVIQAMFPLAIVLSLIAAFEAWLSFRLPETKKAPASNEKVHKIKFRQDSSLYAVVIGLCVFWSVGQMLLAVYPAFAKEYLQIENAMLVQAILASMAIGIMAGSLFDGLLSKQFIMIKFLPLAALLVITTNLALPFTHNALAASMLFLVLGFAGGMVIVPLNALLQFFSPANALASVIAKANLVQNIAMLSCLLLTMLLSFLALPSWLSLLLIALISAVGLSLMLNKLPQVWLAIKSSSPEVIGFDQVVGSGLVVFVAEEVNKELKESLQACYPRLIQAAPIIHKQENAAAYLVAKSEYIPANAHAFTVTLTSAGLVIKPYQS